MLRVPYISQKRGGEPKDSTICQQNAAYSAFLQDAPLLASALFEAILQRPKASPARQQRPSEQPTESSLKTIQCAGTLTNGSNIISNRKNNFLKKEIVVLGRASL